MLKVIGGEQEGEFKAVASGTLPNGKPVVVNSDGTVSVVGETSGTESIGSPDVFNNALTSHTAAVYDTANDKVVIAYRDNGNSNYGTAIVGTVSGSSISFGTEVVFESSGASYVEATYDVASGKVVIAYRDFSDSYGRAIVGTVSGTTISFGTKQVFSTTGSIEQISIVYAETQEKVVIAYRDSGTNGEAVVGTVSGTSISFGTVVEFYTGGSGDYAVVYNPTDSNVIIGFRADSTTSGEAIVGTISGTSISFGSQNRFSENNVNYIKGTYDVAAQRVVFVYSDGTDGSKGKAVVGSISGNTITFGTEVVFNNASTTYPDVNYHVAGQRVVVAYTNESGSLNYGTFIVGAVSGTSITFGSPAVFESASTDYSDLTYDSDTGQMVVAYRDLGGGNVGQTVVFQIDYTVSNLTAENYIGMSRGVVDVTNTSFGSASVFESAIVSQVSSAYDTTNDKIVIAYRDSGNSNYGTAVVGTVSGASISFGTPVVYNSGDTRYTSTLFDPVNAKIVLSYIDWGNSERPTSIVGTVSGTSISFGSEVVMSAVVGSYMTTAFDTNAGKFVASFRDDSNLGYGRAFVGTVSGTSISFGSAGTYNTATTNTPSMVFDSSNNKIVITYVDAGNADTLTSIVGTVSGTSISFGSEVPLSTSGSAANPVSVFDTNSNKVVVLYTESGTSYAPQAIIGTVSGTSISFTTKVEAGNANDYIDYTSMCFDPVTNQVVIAYEAVTTDELSVKTGSVSGSSITFSDPTVVATGPTSSFSIVYDVDTDQVVIPYRDGGDNSYGKGIVGSIGSTNRYPVADGNPASLDIIGSVSTNQSGLTAGEKYYVQTDGTISTTAGSPSVLAGTAISATKLVVKT